jgi:hypothetical protein
MIRARDEEAVKVFDNLVRIMFDKECKISSILTNYIYIVTQSFPTIEFRL